LSVVVEGDWYKQASAIQGMLVLKPLFLPEVRVECRGDLGGPFAVASNAIRRLLGNSFPTRSARRNIP
jgi:hypothetical protein